jgi:hypothetical protein
MDFLSFRNENPYESQKGNNRLKNMKNSQAISSADLFGEHEQGKGRF